MGENFANCSNSKEFPIKEAFISRKAIQNYVLSEQHIEDLAPTTSLEVPSTTPPNSGPSTSNALKRLHAVIENNLVVVIPIILTKSRKLMNNSRG
ncbi:hypothetical protein JTE90_024688 [Oedothorax gibbosus]|uniref:Uncharacterized protein n=1 Tax=Oedothorax gibbosus TaxID=931172 RepID=A0AAV6UAP3_9ARAC|nr:hypothetical protein JTE90_024688 [Oedothorax gibbosus]